MNWFSPRRAASMAAVEMEADNYDYDKEMQDAASDTEVKDAAGLGMKPPMPPAGRYGEPGPSDKNPIHGKGKKDIVDQHKQI
jgi:hypothetical protein